MNINMLFYHYIYTYSRMNSLHCISSILDILHVNTNFPCESSIVDLVQQLSLNILVSIHNSTNQYDYIIG